MNKKFAIIIFLIRTFCSVGFGVVYSSLVLYLIQSMSFSEARAISFTGMLIALHYSLSALSGMILGRWISNINALILGTVFQIISLPIIYHFRSMDMMIWGCTFFLLGSLLSSPTINIIITERFESKDQTREKAFMWNYAGMNLGNITGFSVAGYFQLKDSFSDMSYIPMVVMSFALILCIAYRKKLCDIHTAYSQYNINQKINNLIKTLLLTVCMGIIIKYILLYSSSISNILMVFLIIMFIGFLMLNFKKASNKNNAYMFTILAFSYLVFWSLYFLIPTGLTLFATYNTTGRIFDFSIPPEWLSNINSLLIIIGALLLAIFFKKFESRYRWLTIHKFIIGLLYLAIAFIVINIGIIANHFNLVNLYWLAICYVLLTLSELFIAPVGFAAVGQYVDRKFQPLMNGLWMSILGLGGIIASRLSSLTEISNNSVIESNTQLLKLFLCLSMVSLLCCALLIILNSIKYRFIYTDLDSKKSLG